MAYGHGGYRKGGGRPVDPNSKRSQAKREAAARRGEVWEPPVKAPKTPRAPKVKAPQSSENWKVMPPQTGLAEAMSVLQATAEKPPRKPRAKKAAPLPPPPTIDNPPKAELEDDEPEERLVTVIPVPEQYADVDFLEFLRLVALGKIDATPAQIKAATAGVQYTHRKMGEGGKKEQQGDKAKEASKGKFGAGPAPALKAVA